MIQRAESLILETGKALSRAQGRLSDNRERGIQRTLRETREALEIEDYSQLAAKCAELERSLEKLTALGSR